MQAIITKYLGPTDHRGARIKAIADAGSVMVHWDHALNVEDNHQRAATALAEKFRWLTNTTRLAGGGMPQQTPYAYCFVIIEE